MLTSAEMKGGTRTYRIIDKLGQGGTAVVHLAVQCGPGGFSRQVALKRPRPEFVDSSELRESFVEEARLLSRIQDPHVVSVLELELEPLFIAMEYVPGLSLSALNRKLKKSGARLPPPLAIKIVLDLLYGLSAAHRIPNLVHGDISPQNVLVASYGVAKLTDFGTARAKYMLAQRRADIVQGKGGYVAPEQLKGGFDQRADVFASGVLLWELLSARRLFNCTLEERKYCPVVPVPRIPGISRRVEQVVRRALDGDPNRRYPSARAFADALRAAARRAGWSATSVELADFAERALSDFADRPVAPLARLPRLSQRKRRVASAFALTVALVVSVAVTKTSCSSDPSRPMGRIGRPRAPELAEKPKRTMDQHGANDEARLRPPPPIAREHATDRQPGFRLRTSPVRVPIPRQATSKTPALMQSDQNQGLVVSTEPENPWGHDPGARQPSPPRP